MLALWQAHEQTFTWLKILSYLGYSNLAALLEAVMLNLKSKTTTLMCLSSAKQLQFAVRKGTCTFTYKLMSLMVHAVVVMLSYHT